jgi:ATP-binding cassette subfamily B protein
MPRPGGPRRGAPVEKAKDFKGTIKKLLKYIKEYRLAIIIVMFFSILSTVFSILGPKILGM